MSVVTTYNLFPVTMPSKHTPSNSQANQGIHDHIGHKRFIISVPRLDKGSAKRIRVAALVSRNKLKEIELEEQRKKKLSELETTKVF